MCPISIVAHRAKKFWETPIAYFGTPCLPGGIEHVFKTKGETNIRVTRFFLIITTWLRNRYEPKL